MAWTDDLLNKMEKGGTVRKIDYIIYAENKEIDFLEHQKYILDLVKGHEREVFNSPDYSYFGFAKSTLSGVTGAMSNILTSEFLYLYARLLELGLEVNLPSDIFRLYLIVAYSNIGAMDAEHRAALYTIRGAAKQRMPDHVLFQRGWWQKMRADLTSFKQKCHAAVKDKGFWTGRSPFGLFARSCYYNIDGKLIEYRKDSELFKFEDEISNTHRPLIYETKAPFLEDSVYDQNSRGVLFASNYDYTKIVERFDKTADFFLNDPPPIDISGAAVEENNMMVMAGGSRLTTEHGGGSRLTTEHGGGSMQKRRRSSTPRRRMTRKQKKRRSYSRLTRN